MEKGIFVTFEGIEGSGKSTQVNLFCEHLERNGIAYVRTVEPGGTTISNEIRKILLSVEHSGMTSLTELLLYAAARAQHVGEVIRPSLEKGLVVVCDRFTDSTMAYQGFARGIDRELIRSLNNICTEGIAPDITFLLDLDSETGLRRNREARKIDRLELEDLSFHTRVREGYRTIAAEEGGRIRMIDSSRDIDEIAGEIRGIFHDHITGRAHGV